MRSTLRLLAAVGTVAILGACSVQQDQNGSIRISADPFSLLNPQPQQQMVQQQMVQQQMPYDAAPQQVMAMGPTATYRGQVDGGIATLTLHDIGGYVQARLIVEGRTGGGEVVGNTARRGDTLVMTNSTDGNVCQLSIRLRGQRAEVGEDDCSYWHGASIGFSGTLTRVR